MTLLCPFQPSAPTLMPTVRAYPGGTSRLPTADAGHLATLVQRLSGAGTGRGGQCHAERGRNTGLSGGWQVVSKHWHGQGAGHVRSAGEALMRILVCGSRHGTDKELIRSTC